MWLLGIDPSTFNLSNNRNDAISTTTVETVFLHIINVKRFLLDCLTLIMKSEMKNEKV